MRHGLTRAGFALVHLASVLLPAHAARAAAPSPAPEAADIEIRIRQPLALMIITPGGNKIGSSDTSTLIRMADDALRDVSDLKVFPHDDPGCRGRPACYVETVRSDYLTRLQSFRYEDDGARLRSYSEVQAMLKEAGQKTGAPPPRYLLVLNGTRQSDGSTRLTTLLLDTEEALRLIHEANARNERSDLEKAEALDDRIIQYAKRGNPAPLVVKSDEQIEDYVRGLFQSEFRDELVESGHWMPYGSLVLEASEEGLEIELDGAKVGVTKAGRTVLGAVSPGERAVRVSRAGYLGTELHPVVRAGETSVARVLVAREPSSVARGLRKGVFWGGLGVATLGAALTALAFAAGSTSDNVAVCVHAPGQACPGGPEFLELGASQSAPADIFQDPSRGGVVPFAPLAYSLLGAGATWSLSTLLIGEEDDVPALQLGLGVAVFAASFLLSVALDGKNAVACNAGGC